MKLDRKHLKEQYREAKAPMGCFSLQCTATSEMFIGCAKNLETAKNSLLFRLSVGALLNEPDLQRLYGLYGPDQFTFSVLESLAYDEHDESKEYGKDLEALLSLCLETYPKAKEIHI